MNELKDILIEMTGFFREFLPLEQEKLKAAENKQVTFVEECMTKEQAMILKLKGYEKRREDALKKAGLEGKTLSEITETLSGEERVQMQAVTEAFSRAVREFHSVNEEALKLIRLNLRELDTVLAEKGQDGQPGGKTPGHLTNQIV